MGSTLGNALWRRCPGRRRADSSKCKEQTTLSRSCHGVFPCRLQLLQNRTQASRLQIRHGAMRVPWILTKRKCSQNVHKPKQISARTLTNAWHHCSVYIMKSKNTSLTHRCPIIYLCCTTDNHADDHDTRLLRARPVQVNFNIVGTFIMTAHNAAKSEWFRT